MGTAKPIDVGDRHFAKQGDALQAVRDLVARYPEGARVTDPADETFLRDLVDLHDDPSRKVGKGIEYFQIEHVEGTKNLSFFIKQLGRNDLEDFTWTKTIAGRPSVRAEVTQALVNAGRPVTDEFRRRAFESGPVTIDGRVYARESDVQVRHLHPPLRDLAAQFVADHGGWSAIGLVESTGRYPGKEPVSEEICDAWRAWQVAHAGGLGLAPAVY